MIITRAVHAQSGQNADLRSESLTRRDLRAPDGGVILTGSCQSLVSFSLAPLLLLPSSVFARIGSSIHHNILNIIFTNFLTNYLPTYINHLSRLINAIIHLSHFESIYHDAILLPIISLFHFIFSLSRLLHLFTT